MGYLLKNGNTTRHLLFMMIDSSDHITGKTGLTVTVTLSKNGAAFASPSGAVSEISSGWYKVAANATDAGTNGPLLLHATATGADPTDDRFEVVAFDPDTATNLGITALPNVASGSAGGLLIQGTGTTGLNVASGKAPATIAAGDLATDSITASALKTDAITEIVSAIWQDTTAGDFTVSGSIGKSLFTSGNAPGAASGLALVGSNVGAATSVSGAVGSVTGNVGGNVTGSVGSVVGAVGSVTGNVGGNVTGSVGSINGITFPTNFSALGISAGGNILIVDTLTTYTGNTVQTGDSYARIGAPVGASMSADIATLAAYVDTEVAAIKAKTDNLPTNTKNWLGALAGKTADSGTLAEIQETTAGAGYDNTTDSLQAVRDNLPTGSGSGANTVTITVQTTGSVAIEGASVSAWNSSTLIATGTTNASGVVVLSLDSATYTVNVSKAGYNGTSASLSVSGATSSTRQLSAITITPSDPPAVTGYAYTYESNGTTIRTGVDIEYFMVRTDVGGTGSIVDPDTETLTSNGSGLVEFTGLLAGATYKAREVGQDKWHSFVADDETFQIKSFVG